jgi:hypothetical protein
MAVTTEPLRGMTAMTVAMNYGPPSELRTATYECKHVAR